MAINKGKENIHIKLLVEQRDLKGFFNFKHLQQ